MSQPMKLAEYLFARLRQLGVGSIHGVPGHFNLTLLDYIEPSGLLWVGNTNELNAAYAADAYARIKGIGALITTFGVSELSAVNAIAGAYAERAPVVHIVGVPDRQTQESRLLTHHTFNDGDFTRFSKIHSYITVAQTRLWDPRRSTQQIDDTLSQCLRHSRSVYIEIPVDLVSAMVSKEMLAKPITSFKSRPNPALREVLDRILNKISDAKRPVIVVDGECRPLGIVDNVLELMKATMWPTWATPFGKGLVDETQENFQGIYQGKFSHQATRDFFEEADLILCFGPHFSSSNTYGFSSVPKPEQTILFSETKVTIQGKAFWDISALEITSELCKAISNDKVCQLHQPPLQFRNPGFNQMGILGDEALSHDRIWRIFSDMLRPGDIVLGETGTAGYGVREMRLPKQVRVFTPATWLSIEYMLPGSQGAALAQRELIEESRYPCPITEGRTILFIGDGSFQMTAQELATIIRHNLNVIVFLLNNDEYTIERRIHGRKQGYNDISSWRYLEAPSFFGAHQNTYTACVKTFAELSAVLSHEQIMGGKGLRMVELVLDHEDAPKGPLLQYLNEQS